MRIYRLARFLLAFLLAVGMACSVHAQFPQRESIGRVVTDSSGDVYPYAALTLEDLDGNQKSGVNTGQSGHYLFAQLLISNYRATVEIASFNKSAPDPLTVTSQDAR